MPSLLPIMHSSANFWKIVASAANDWSFVVQRDDVVRLISADLVFPADPQQENVWAKVINIAHWCIVWWNEDFMPFDLPTSLTFDQKILDIGNFKEKKRKITLFNKWDA